MKTHTFHLHHKNGNRSSFVFLTAVPKLLGKVLKSIYQPDKILINANTNQRLGLEELRPEQIV